MFRNLDSHIESLREVVSTLDLRVEQGYLCGKCEVEEQVLCGRMVLMRIKYSRLFQRSRARWLNEGDANTSFFHACVKSRSRRNDILALKVGDV